MHQVLDVSIRAPVRGAACLLLYRNMQQEFQSAPPCGGRPHCGGTLLTHSCFNPRPRAGGGLQRPRRLARPLVSIRAPVRGAAAQIGQFGRADRVSIRAPVRGAASSKPPRTSSTLGFNPRPRAGGGCGEGHQRQDHTRFNPRPRAGGGGLPTRDWELFSVSIRAPVRGAARRNAGAGQGPKCFNPRPRAGGGAQYPPVRYSSNAFQSAPPCGGRPGRTCHPSCAGRFQSAPPCGGRHGPRW